VPASSTELAITEVPQSQNESGQAGIHTASLPRHVAIIMDGNGRWAKARMLPRVEGHRQGAKSVRMVVEESRRLGIRYLTLFVFSTENWSRPPTEVKALMTLFGRYLASERKMLVENGVRLRAIGNLDKLAPELRSELENSIEATKDLGGMELILAVSYGGREELSQAVKQIAVRVQSGALLPEQIDDDVIRSCLYAPDVPDPDLLIRTSNQNRLSNFLLWQLVYTEIVVSESLWPAFNKEEYNRCLEEYAGRNRRFGLTDEQVKQMENSRVKAFSR